MAREYRHKMIRHPRPMFSFDPSKRAIVYEQANDAAFEWEPARWGASFYQNSTPLSDRMVEWDGLLLAGWCTPDEWDREWRSTIVDSPLARRAAPLVWVTPEGSGYALTEFGPFTAQDEWRLRHAIRKVRPHLGPRRFKISRLRQDQVLYLQFNPPLDDADHLFVVVELSRELERRQDGIVANDNQSGGMARL